MVKHRNKAKYISDEMLQEIIDITISLSKQNESTILKEKQDTIKANAKLLFKFKVNGKDYPIGVGPGTKVVVRKTASGRYNLLPEETAKLSPPPLMK